MEESEELTQTIEDCGAAEMPIDEMCEIAEISQHEFENSKILTKAYRRGQLKSKLQVRQAVVKMAVSGSPAMVKLYLDFNGHGDRPIESDDDLSQI